VEGGVVQRVVVDGGVVRAAIEGPPNPLREVAGVPCDCRSPHLDATRGFVKLVVGAEERLLRAGEWSDWVPVVFPLAWDRRSGRSAGST
jgi:hypothetical protein